MSVEDAQDRMKVPSLHTENGFTTAMIGKWNLGLDTGTTDGMKASRKAD